MLQYTLLLTMSSLSPPGSTDLKESKTWRNTFASAIESAVENDRVWKEGPLTLDCESGHFHHLRYHTEPHTVLRVIEVMRVMRVIVTVLDFIVSDLHG
jgi:hypothetical protein